MKVLCKFLPQKISFDHLQKQKPMAKTEDISITQYNCISWRFFISDGSLKKITEDTFDNDNYYTVEEQDNQTRHQGYKMTTASSGTDWRHDASKEEKYQIIVEAYLKCLNS